MYNTLNTTLNENQTLTNYINVLRNAMSNEDTIIYVFDIKTKDKIKQQIIQIAIYHLLDQLNTQQSIYILTDKAYQYNINIHQLNDNSTIKYIPHTKPNDMLLYKQIAIPTELKNKLFDEVPNGSCIVVDDVNRFITHYTFENSNTIHRKKNDLITKLISEYKLKNNKYVLIDNDYFDMLDAQQKDRVKKIEIDISLDNDSDTYTLSLNMDNTKYNIPIKHQDVDTDDILLNMQMDTHSISDLVPLRTNVKLFDTEIMKYSLKWGNLYL
jgi:adenosyl cobinamide kinase/adenosyl cobinamide phosphate guanylyltransferase